MVFVNTKLKYVYFCIHKNATSTIRYLILQNELNNPDIEYNWKNLYFTFKKLNIYVLRNKKQLEDVKDYFWFIFFRNPYDRVISTYNDKVIAMPGDQIYESLYNPRMSLRNFIENIVCLIPDEFSDLHFRSQTYGSVREYIDNFNFIGTIENFDNDIKIIKEKLNLKYEPKKLRKTKKRNLDPYLKEKLYERYKDDFEIFKSLGINYK